MKSACAATLLLVLSAGVVTAEESNPLGKVFQLMNSLEGQINREGDVEAKAFKQLFEWCDSASKNTGYEIETGSAKKDKLSAKIDETTSDIEVGTSKIGDLSGAISTADAELKEATGIRNQELADFGASEK